MPLTRMNAENSSPMAVSPTPKAALIWSLLPRTMYWSIPSTNRVRPTTHMGQLLMTMRRADRVDPSPVCAELTTGPPPVARRSLRPRVRCPAVPPSGLGPRRVPGRQGDRLHFEEALQALGPELAPEARLL